MKRCLIVVDYQNDFVTGALGFSEAIELERCITDKIRKYRANGDDIIFTFDTHNDNYMNTQEGQKLPIPHCIINTDGHKLYGEVAELVEESDKRFYKKSFGSEELFEHLKGTFYQSIELIGVVSNICVISNAILAKTAQPETLILVDSRCVASNDSKLNSAALDVMASLQIEII